MLASLSNILELFFESFSQEFFTKFINLLSVENLKNEIILNFSLDITIKLLIDKIEIYLDDLDMPWPTGKKPMHK